MAVEDMENDRKRKWMTIASSDSKKTDLFTSSVFITFLPDPITYTVVLL